MITNTPTTDTAADVIRPSERLATVPCAFDEVIHLGPDTISGTRGISLILVEGYAEPAVAALTLAQARRLGHALLDAAHEPAPLTEGYLRAARTIGEALGAPVEEVAADLGIDLDTATVDDLGPISRRYADLMAGSRS